jgi:hypothetical protein
MTLDKLLNALVTETGRFFGTLHDYVLSGLRRRVEPVTDPESLRRFVETRSSYIAQTSLYGYLRTRAGMRYPELFHDDPFVVSINIAKWHMWLACLSDLSVYAGTLLERGKSRTGVDVGPFMVEMVEGILQDTGVPEEADQGEFPEHAERVRTRLRQHDWGSPTEDAALFSESPRALVRYAPIVEELKRLDDEIVTNSVRFHWHEIRRELIQQLDADAVLAALEDAAGGSGIRPEPVDHGKGQRAKTGS